MLACNSVARSHTDLDPLLPVPFLPMMLSRSQTVDRFIVQEILRSLALRLIDCLGGPPHLRKVTTFPSIRTNGASHHRFERNCGRAMASWRHGHDSGQVRLGGTKGWEWKKPRRDLAGFLPETL